MYELYRNMNNIYLMLSTMRFDAFRLKLLHIRWMFRGLTLFFELNSFSQLPVQQRLCLCSF